MNKNSIIIPIDRSTMEGDAMKTFSRLLIFVALIGSLTLFGACSNKPVAPYTPSDNTKMDEGKNIEYTTPEYSEENGPSEETLDSTGGKSGEELDQTSTSAADQPTDEYKKEHGRSSEQLLPIYFDFDQASIRGDQSSQLEANADYLKNNTAERVIIEGNSDDRGTNEYNLALAERRALNAKTYLIELGVEEHRIRTVSYGEERPLFTGQDEFSWSQNRRDDFMLE